MMESRLPCWVKTARLQSSTEPGLLENMEKANDRHDQVERQVDAYENYGNVDRFLKALEEDGAQDGEQEESNGHLVAEGVRSVGIVDKMGGCVRCGKGHGDDEVGGGETQEDEH